MLYFLNPNQSIAFGTAVRLFLVENGIPLWRPTNNGRVAMLNSVLALITFRYTEKGSSPHRLNNGRLNAQYGWQKKSDIWIAIMKFLPDYQYFI